MALIKLPEISPRYYTYLGFAFALAGLILTLATLVMIFNLFNAGQVCAWPISAGAAMVCLFAATLSFHKMGAKKVIV